jgi:hypothetical protein
MTCYSLGPLYIITDLPTYNIAANVVSVNEGGSVTFTITTTRVPDGTVLYYQLSPVSGAVTDADFTGTGLFSPNAITINNNTATFTVTTVDEGVVEGTEIFRALLITGCQSTNVAQSGAISINEVPVASLYDSFRLNTSNMPGFDYYTGAWKGNFFAVAHDTWPKTGGTNSIYHPNLGYSVNHKMSGAVLNTGTSTMTLQQKLTATRYTSETADIAGRSISWTKDYVFINYNVYRRSNWYRFFNADFASGLNSQSYGYDWDDSDGGDAHEAFIIGNRYGKLRQVGNDIEFYDAQNNNWYNVDYQGWFMGGGMGSATHPDHPIVVSGASGRIFWQNVDNASASVNQINLPATVTDNGTRSVNMLKFTTDGKFLIVGTYYPQATVNYDPNDSSILVYETSVTNGNLSLTLRGHPQQDVDSTIFGNRNFFNIRSSTDFSVGNRLMAYGRRMYTLSESGVFTKDDGLSNYFMGPFNSCPATQEIGNTNYNLRGGRQFIINEDDTKVAVLGDTVTYSTGTFQGGVWVFNLL